jgi:uncharacterized protein
MDTADRLMDDLQAALDAVPAPFEPLDVSALDGFLVGVALQPQPVAAAQWLRFVHDDQGRTAPPSLDLGPLHSLARGRFDALQQAIHRRQWFDPWVFELEPPATAADAVLPWIAGWVAAQEAFPALLQMSDPALREPLATLFAYFDPDDLDDVDDIADLLEDMAPAETMDDAVQDLVRSTLLMADVSRPHVAHAAPGTKTARPGHPPPRRSPQKR